MSDNQVPDVDSEDEFPPLDEKLMRQQRTVRATQQGQLPPNAPVAPAVPPPAPNNNDRALADIEKDLNVLLNFVNKNEGIVDDLNNQLQENKKRIVELEKELQQERNNKESLQKQLNARDIQHQELLKVYEESKKNIENVQSQLTELQAEKDTLGQDNLSLNNEIQRLEKVLNDGGSEGEALRAQVAAVEQEKVQLQQQLEDSKVREGRLTQEKEDTRGAIDRVRGKVTDINLRVRAQMSKLDALQRGSGQRGGNPFSYMRKRFKLMSLARKMKGASRDKLNRLAIAWNINYAAFPKKQDLIKVLKIVFYCKMGVMRKKTHLKSVAGLLGIDLKDARKKGKDMCPLVLRRMSSVSVKAAEQILA